MRQAILDNPTLFADALTDRERSPKFKWHSHANSPRSSQVFCLSAFGGLRGLAQRDGILAGLFGAVLPGFETPGNEPWEILPEEEDPDLLGEHGSNQPTSVDVLCRSATTVVAIESKFVTDAQSGFGACSQATRGACSGHHGPGSDLSTATAAWCRLENWEKRRAPRRYWAIGRRYFRDEVFAKQSPGEACPFAGPNYQLMRNFLFAASMAERDGRPSFFLLTIAPRAFADHLTEQLERFRRDILRSEFADCAGFIAYEGLAESLRAQPDQHAQRLGDFLLERIATVVG